MAANERVKVVCPADLDNCRRNQTDIPSRPEALRRLATAALPNASALDQVGDTFTAKTVSGRQIGSFGSTDAAADAIGAKAEAA